MAKLFRMLFASVVCIFVCCGASGVFPVMAHSNDVTLLRKETINAVETMAKDAEKMGDGIVGGYTKFCPVPEVLETLLNELLKKIIVVDEKVDKFAASSENYLSFAINDARSEIIEAAVCVGKIKNTTVNSVKEGGGAADKTGDFVQKATAVKAALGSVKSVDWTKEEKELKVMAEALRDVWEKSKEDVEWQMEEANNAFERINDAIGETKNAVEIVKHHIKQVEEMQKAYEEKKGETIKTIGEETIKNVVETDEDGDEDEDKDDDEEEDDEETEESRKKKLKKIKKMLKQIDEALKETKQNLETLEEIEKQLVVISETLKVSINKTSEIRAELAESHNSITNTVEKYQNVIESLELLTAADKTTEMAKTEWDGKKQQRQRNGNFIIYDGSAVIYCFAEFAGLSFVLSAVFTCVLCLYK